MQHTTSDVAESVDPRVQRTVEAIQKAFVTLMNSRRFEAITVGDIARVAQINRATFYRHFPDKYGLALSVIQGAIQTLSVDLDAAQSAEDIHLDQRDLAWRRLFSHIDHHRSLYRPLLGRHRDPWIANRMQENAAGLVRERLRHAGPAGGPVHLPDDVATLFAVELLLAVVGLWVEGDLQGTPEEVARWFVRFVSLGYFQSLGYRVQR